MSRRTILTAAATATAPDQAGPGSVYPSSARPRWGWPWLRSRLGALGWLILFLPAMPANLHGAALYRVDQRNGTIGFSIGVLGLFSVQGRFPRFEGEVVLDRQAPEHSRIDVTINTALIEMPQQDAVGLLRSEAYFDTSHHPVGHFVSTEIRAFSPTHYLVHGTLELRGITRSQDLDAVLSGRHVDVERHVDVADFVVTAQINRSDFGMLADRPMLSDTVHLEVRMRLMMGLDPDAH